MQSSEPEPAEGEADRRESLSSPLARMGLKTPQTGRKRSVEGTPPEATTAPATGQDLAVMAIRTLAVNWQFHWSLRSVMASMMKSSRVEAVALRPKHALGLAEAIMQGHCGELRIARLRGLLRSCRKNGRRRGASEHARGIAAAAGGGAGGGGGGAPPHHAGLCPHPQRGVLPPWALCLVS